MKRFAQLAVGDEFLVTLDGPLYRKVDSQHASETIQDVMVRLPLTLRVHETTSEPTMDPTATLRDILDTLVLIRPDQPGFRSQAADSLRDLADWIEKDGFPPALVRHESGLYGLK